MKMFLLEAWCWSYGMGYWIIEHSTVLTTIVITLIIGKIYWSVRNAQTTIQSNQ